MSTGNSQDPFTLFPSNQVASSALPSHINEGPKKAGDNVVERWLNLLERYEQLAAQPNLRREEVVSIENYARENGLWLALDSIPRDVVVAEIQARQAAGEEVKHREYVARFPHLSQQFHGIAFGTRRSGVGNGPTELPSEGDTVSTVIQKGEHVPDAAKVVTLTIGSQFGQYHIDREIGQGGMGAVYGATHLKLNKKVALKILPVTFDESDDRALRFEREMRSLGRVDHPNIVRALDAGEINGVKYLAMEYVEGVDLQDMVKNLGPCLPELACNLIGQTTAGLQFAHDAGLVHRDIKPSNILVTRDGTVKIVDMGLARLQSTNCSEEDATNGLTLQRQMMGTPDYMAPEQWANAAEADGRADIYSLGCTLYFLLSGQPPYGANDTKTVSRKMKAHLSSPTPKLEIVREDLPAELIKLYERMMAKDPERRPQTAKEISEALNRIFDNSHSPQKTATLVDMNAIEKTIQAQNATRSTLRFGVKSWFIAALAFGMLGALALMSLWNRPNRGDLELLDRGDANPLDTTITVEVIQKHSETDLERRGIIGQQIDSARHGDLAKLAVRFATPRYCYVVAFNPADDPEWRVQLLYPVANDIKPEFLASLSIPSKGTKFLPLTDGVGQQVYVVIESSQSLPTFHEWTAGRDLASAWKKCQRSGVWKYAHGDLSLQPLQDQQRAAIVDIAPPELSELIDSVDASTSDTQKITAIAFPVQASLSR